MAAEIQVRTGQAPPALTREAFGERFRVQFYDPRFDDERDAIRRLEEIAWRNYQDGRKAPRTVEAGPGFANPDMRISVEWKATRDRLIVAEKTQKDPGTPSRVLIVCGSPRNDGSCPGEVSKTWRLANVARDTAVARDVEVDLLDLSLLTSGYRYHIHPCKGCVSTAQPLCHWPCSCYPNHDLGQADDWMNEIYERWTLAHGVILVLPVHWYMATSPVKLMMDRLVRADGGNPDPTSTRGKNAQLAKSIEMQGWGYPKHLAGRVYGIVVHGDVAGIEDTRRALSDWLDWMGLIDAGPMARLDRFIGFTNPMQPVTRRWTATRASNARRATLPLR